MKAIEQYFPVVLNMLCKVALTFESVDEILRYEQYLPVVLFIMLYKVPLRL